MRHSFYEQLQRHQKNNLNALRLFLAVAVIFSHASILSYGNEGEFRGEFLATFNSGQMTIGQAAVNLFFFISGILITASFLKNKNLQHFLINRFLRIYPAYIAAMVFSASVIWIFCPEFRANVGRGFSWIFVFLRDCLFLDYQSISWPSVFQNNPFPGRANASLWTIPWEFKCYIFAAFIGLFGLFKFRSIILIATIFAFCVYTASHFTGWVVVGGKTEWRFLSFFLCGVCAWLWRDKLPYSPLLAAGGLVILFIAGFIAPWFQVVFPIFGTYLILWIGYCKPWAALQWTDRTDLSYGVYLFAFPIQQILATQEIFRVPWLQFLVATPLALGCAWLSWTFIEKRFLQMKGWQPEDYDPVFAAHNGNAKLKEP